MRNPTFFGIFAVLLLAAGCQSTPTTGDQDAGGPAGGDQTGQAGAATSGLDEQGGFSGMDLDGTGAGAAAQAALDTLVIYFEFDSIDIGGDYEEILVIHGQHLAENPSATLRLEGHADERGSREYNIGLGERRSQAVRRILILQGATAEQISTVSFGEERPAEFGSTEEAWARNRRVEIVYR